MTEVITRPTRYDTVVSCSGQQNIILGWRDLAEIEMKFCAAWDYLDEHGLMNDELSDLFKAATGHVTELMDHTTEPPFIVAAIAAWCEANPEGEK